MRVLLIILMVLTAPLAAQEVAPDSKDNIAGEPPMTLARLQAILKAIDEDAILRGIGAELTIDDVPVLVIADAPNDRMRAMVPIRSADGMTEAELLRLMQANFDTALDARYAVAQGRLWGVFIHPLSPLTREQLISGLIQTVNVARTYGQAYTGGAQHFGGGDSNGIYRELLQELLDKGQEL
ncbi:MAG: hypothetical protein AAF891_07395 [Pseudomonadota bacterium]